MTYSYRFGTMVWVEPERDFSLLTCHSGGTDILEAANKFVFAVGADRDDPIIARCAVTDAIDAAGVVGISRPVSLISGSIDFSEIEEAIVGPNVVDVVDLLRPISEGDQPSQTMEAIVMIVDRDAKIPVSIRRSSYLPRKPGIPNLPASIRGRPIEGRGTRTPSECSCLVIVIQKVADELGKFSIVPVQIGNARRG